MAFSITRSIGVDYGHRVMTHGSKCRSIHGHRGTIEVTCAGSALHESGEQAEMVLDFGFLKDAMMNVIDKSIDHGFIASVDDHELLRHLISEHLNPNEAVG
jgi:6-pyruvoyltetrahydropterin/6-carboxytetrahydropterin synthase